MKTITGAMTALVTPFKNGKVDEETYAKLIKRQIDNGIDAVVPVGTTGESATLTHDEHKKCIEIAVDVAKGTNAKVVAGAGSNATHESIDLAKFAESAGADGLLCVTPYYNKPTQNGLYEHYKAIASAVTIDVMLYNVPGRTGTDIEPKTVIKMFDEIPNVNSIKEATGSLSRVIELNSKRPDLAIISGEDAINYPMTACGGAGCISVTSNLLPKEISDLIHWTTEGKHKEAKDLSNRLCAINSALFVESNPIPIKAAMYIAGIIPTLEYRLPLTKMQDDNYKMLEKIVKQYI